MEKEQFYPCVCLHVCSRSYWLYGALFLMIGKISIITLIPVIGIIIMMFSVIILSKRENISEFNSSLENIESIDRIK